MGLVQISSNRFVDPTLVVGLCTHMQQKKRVCEVVVMKDGAKHTFNSFWSEQDIAKQIDLQRALDKYKENE